MVLYKVLDRASCLTTHETPYSNPLHSLCTKIREVAHTLHLERASTSPSVQRDTLLQKLLPFHEWSPFSCQRDCEPILLQLDLFIMIIVDGSPLNAPLLKHLLDETLRVLGTLSKHLAPIAERSNLGNNECLEEGLRDVRGGRRNWGDSEKGCYGLVNAVYWERLLLLCTTLLLPQSLHKAPHVSIRICFPLHSCKWIHLAKAFVGLKYPLQLLCFYREHHTLFRFRGNIFSYIPT